MIRLTIPPEAASMEVLRATAGAIAARAPLTLDQIDDVRLAVEEAAMVLLPAGLPITMAVRRASDPFTVQVSVDSIDRLEIDTDSLAWMVLQGTTDTVDVEQSATDTSLRLTFDLARARS